jgi:putative endopeptidase
MRLARVALAALAPAVLAAGPAFAQARPTPDRPDAPRPASRRPAGSGTRVTKSPLAEPAAAAAAAAAAPARTASAAPAAASPAAAPRGRGIDPAHVDTTCAPCRNFYQFATGGWAKRTTIPAAYAAWGSFHELADRNQLVLRRIVEGAAADTAAARGTNAQKIGAFYRACMDSAAVERAGLAPVRPLLDRIAALRTAADVRAALGPLERDAGLAPFGANVQSDDKNSDSLLVTFGQGGLGLPDRDYYLTQDARSQQLRDAYVRHVARMLALGGADSAAAAAGARQVMALETALARASMTLVEQRDPNATYHRMPLAEFQRSTPGMDWARFLRDVGAPAVATVNVRQPAFFRAADSLLAAVPVDTWKAYLRWRALRAGANALPAAFVNEQFAFNRSFTGAKELRPRWKRCVDQTNAAVGELVGQEYVRQTFTPEAKARALDMVANLRAALAERLDALTWMGDSTKRQARAKLDAFTPKIGYPDRWIDYGALQVGDTSYYANLRAAERFTALREYGKLGKPVDKGEWGMTPPTVNAYYNPSWNEIVFPAGILQPPFYDPEADDAVNYGAMGAVIGHEMTHGFDDQGRQYDARGNLRDWWTPADAARYDAEADKVVRQFAAYTVVDSATRVNGKLTLGENIADLGGLTIAYRAFQKSIENKRLAPIDGFTPDQRFFLGWAQVWRTLQRDEAARAQVLQDPHAPAMWRVNGPLANMPEFRAAWGCKEGDPMVRPAAARAQIW